MRVHVLRNPAGGNRASRRAAAESVGRLRGAGHEVVELTGDSRAASEGALRSALAANEIERLVVAGGDGLVHLAIQHVAETDVTMILAPTGTGNDFATALGVTANSTPIEQMIHQPATAVDLIKVRAVPGISTGSVETNPNASEAAPGISTGSVETNPNASVAVPGISTGSVEKYVASIAIAGFPAAINARANDMSLRLGSQIYTLAAALELPRFERLLLDLVVDDEALTIDTAMLAIGNTSLFGGGMLACPGATATDGYLHVTSIDGVGRLGILRHLKGRAGGTADRDEVIRRRARRIAVTTPGVAFWADGEPLAVSPLELELHPAILNIAGIATMEALTPQAARTD